MHPQFLAIGHLTQDLTPEGYSWGGAVTYAALTALRLGRSPAVVTAGALSAADLDEALAGIAVACKASQATTTFANRYHGGDRTQRVLARAEPLGPQDIPKEWRQAPLVLLCPVIQELSPTLARSFADSSVAASLQGWLRAWDEAGQVHQRPWWDEEGILPEMRMAVLSREDAQGDESLISFYRSRTPLLVVTEGKAGAVVYEHGVQYFIPAFPARVKDPTGAGDAFAAAFLIALEEGQRAVAAARFASCVASFVVEGRGTTSIPTRAQVERRLQEAPRLPR